MFYKKEENGNWLIGKKIKLPTGEILSSQNKEEKYNWIWYDTEPEEYLDWKKTINNTDIIKRNYTLID